MCIAITTELAAPSLALSQTRPGAWSPPQALFEAGREDERVWSLVVATDPAGSLHLFWSYQAADSQYGRGNLIFYSRFDGRTWSEPNNVVFVPQGVVPWNLATAVDPASAEVHLAWLGYGGKGYLVYHSHARISDAHSAHAWSQPEVFDFAAGAVSVPQLVFDNTGGLSVVFETPSGVFYTSAGRGDKHVWTLPVKIDVASEPSQVRVSDLKMDEAGHLHVVYVRYSPASSKQQTANQVFYSRSLDGGRTWSQPFAMSEVGAFEQPAIAIGRAREIHVMWTGTAGASGRYHRYSLDGGDNWSAAERFVPYSGWAGKPLAAVDSSGTLHVVTAGNIEGHGAAFAYTYLNGTTRAEPAIVSAGFQGEMPVGAILNGNLLVVAGLAYVSETDTDFDKVWYTTQQLASPTIPTVALPTARPTAAVVPSATALRRLPAATSTPGMQSPLAAAQLPRPAASPPSVMQLAITPLVILLVVVLVMSLRRTRDRK